MEQWGLSILTNISLSSLTGEEERTRKSWRTNDQSHPLLNSDTSKILTFGKKPEVINLEYLELGNKYVKYKHIKNKD